MIKLIKRLFSLIFLIFILGTVYYIYHIHQAVLNVKEYEPVVVKVIEDETIDKDLVLAIIFQETKGGKVDVMQSSESVTGSTNTTDDSTTSIENGVSHLAEVLAYAEEKETDIWTGVQAYNFGIAYVDYVALHGSIHTITLAENYSKDILAPSLGNANAQTYSYKTIKSMKYNKGKLYVNGGNFFYAEEIKVKMQFMKWLDW
ncbi:MAG: lysozyme family protein [Lactovum sp.]